MLNYFRKQREVNKLESIDSEKTHAVELTLPGLMNPQSVQVDIRFINNNKYAVITGEVFDERHYAKLGYQLATYKVVKFEELVLVPASAADAIPKAVLTVSKDNCGNHQDGILRLEWTLIAVPVPIEIKDCGVND